VDITVKLIKLCLNSSPKLQAIYLFGSYATENEWPNSDISLLLPYDYAENLYMTTLHQQLENLYQKTEFTMERNYNNLPGGKLKSFINPLNLMLL